MKCLSIQQPWAHAILVGDKPVENRTWYCGYHGRLLIHAGKTFDKDGALTIKYDFPDTFENLMFLSPLPKGAILGAVTMVECVKHHDSEWFCGPYGFVFRDPILFVDPIPYKGQLGLFDVPYKAVRDAIEKAERINAG